MLFDRTVAFPRLRVEYVNLDSMVGRHRQNIDNMKKLFGYAYPEGTVFPSEDGGPALVPSRKYLKDLFYIVPLLHRWVQEAAVCLIQEQGASGCHGKAGNAGHRLGVQVLHH